MVAWSSNNCILHTRRGVALVVVLSIMTITALMAVVFATLVTIEDASRRLSQAALQAHLLASSARQHARAVLHADLFDSPGWTHRGQNANLVTVNSDEFRIHVHPETLRATRDTEGGATTATRESDTVVRHMPDLDKAGAASFITFAIY